MRLVLYQGPPGLGEAIQWSPPKTLHDFRRTSRNCLAKAVGKDILGRGETMCEGTEG